MEISKMGFSMALKTKNCLTPFRRSFFCLAREDFILREDLHTALIFLVRFWIKPKMNR
jgi:hypothetical protein